MPALLINFTKISFLFSLIIGLIDWLIGYLFDKLISTVKFGILDSSELAPLSANQKNKLKVRST